MNESIAYPIICLSLLLMMVGAYFLFRYSNYMTVTPKALLVSSAFMMAGFIVLGVIFLLDPTLRPRTLEFLLIAGGFLVIEILWGLFMLKLKDRMNDRWNKRNK